MLNLLKICPIHVHLRLFPNKRVQRIRTLIRYLGIIHGYVTSVFKAKLLLQLGPKNTRDVDKGTASNTKANHESKQEAEPSTLLQTQNQDASERSDKVKKTFQTLHLHALVS